jgi:hypothetical protein
MRRRLKSLAAAYHRGLLDFSSIQRRVHAWLGHAAFGDTWRLRASLFSGVTLLPAEHGQAARRFVEQQSSERPRLEP